MKTRWCSWAALFGFVCMMYFMNATFPHCSDDCYWAMRWTGLEWVRIDSIWEAVKLEAVNPHRPFVHFVTRLFAGCWGKSVFNVFNAAMVGVLILCINRLARRTWALEWRSLLVIISLTFFVLCKGESYLWMCGSVNYLWAGALTLAFCMFREELEDGSATTVATLCWIPLACVAGASNESFSPPICIAIALLTLGNLRDLNWKKVLVYGAYGLSAAALCLYETGRSSQVPAYTLSNVLLSLAKVLYSAKCFWLVVLVFLFARDKKGFLKNNSFELLVVVLDLIIVTAIGFVGERVMWVANLMSLVIIVREWRPRPAIALAFGLAVLLVFPFLVPIGLRLKSNFDEFIADYQKSETGVVCHDYVDCGVFSRFFFQVMYQWQPMGYHPNALSRFYGRSGFLPIALTRELYEGVYRTDSFCSASHRLPIELECYSSDSANTIVVPIRSGGALDRPFDTVRVAYADGQGLFGRLRRGFSGQGRPDVSYPAIPVRLKTAHGDYWLVAKDSDRVVRGVKFSFTGRISPDEGAWYMR